MVIKTLGKIVGMLPVGSFFKYTFSNRIDFDRRGLAMTKSLGHMLYAAIGVSLVVGYTKTGEINPIAQARAMANHANIRDALTDHLFGKNGLADTNQDGTIDITERVEAFRRMGLADKVEESLPIPYVEELKTAVTSYEAEKQ